MQVPIQITFHQCEHSEALAKHVRQRAEELEQFFPRLTSCRVVVSGEARHKHQGRSYNVRVDIATPGHHVSVHRDHDEDPFVATRDAFDAARRQLEDLARELRGDVKQHAQTFSGVVARLNREEGFGFIETPDGETFYFSSLAVIEPPFEHLAEGDRVQFIEQLAAEGRQAQRVRRVAGP
jgi:ribosomal subunit interface protein